MTKSELIHRIAEKQSQIVERDVELAVKTMLDQMAECLAGGGRIEIRGFGSFTLRFRRARVGRNGPRELDSAVSGIFLGFQAAKSR